MPRSKDDTAMISIMLDEFKKVNKISVLKEEENVIRRFLRGYSKQKVVDYLKEKYPKETITHRDVDKFMLLYKDILMSEHANIEKGYVRRLIKTKTGLNNELIDLALVAKDMVTKYDSQEDNGNAVAALRAAADIFMKVAKVEGLAKDQPDININMQMDKMITEVTASDSAFKNAVMKVIDTSKDNSKVVDAEYEIKDEE